VDAKLMALFAENLRDAFFALRGRNELTDYGPKELDGSWQMQKLADDLIWSMGPERDELNPFYLGKTLNALGDLGYKNTTLIQKSFEKLIQEAEGKRVPKSEIGVDEFAYGTGPAG